MLITFICIGVHCRGFIGIGACVLTFGAQTRQIHLHVAATMVVFANFSIPSGWIFIPVTPLAFHQMWKYQVDYAIPQFLCNALTTLASMPRLPLPHWHWTCWANLVLVAWSQHCTSKPLPRWTASRSGAFAAAGYCCILFYLMLCSCAMAWGATHKLTTVWSLWTSCKLGF